MTGAIPMPPMPWSFKKTRVQPPGVTGESEWWAVLDASGLPLAWVGRASQLSIPLRFVGHTLALGASSWPLIGRMDALLCRVATTLKDTGSVALADELASAMEEYHRCRERGKKSGDDERK